MWKIFYFFVKSGFFLGGKFVRIKKMEEWDIKEYLMATEDLLPPLQRETVGVVLSPPEKADAFLTLKLRGDLPTEFFHFLVEIKSQNTPRIIHQAIAQIQAYTKERNDPNVFPMIVVPYLSEDRLADLEEAGVSGIDLCGNGIVTIPGRIFVFRTGNENRYPASRPVSNPFQGKSGVVGRMFLNYEYATVLDGDENRVRETGRQTAALAEIREGILQRGVDISLAQVSKAVSALVEERIVGKQGRAIYILDPDRLMAELAGAWKKYAGNRIYCRLADSAGDLTRLNEDPELDWAVTGESSVSRYAAFGQGGPLEIAVSNRKKALELLDARIESVPSFANAALLESDEPAYYFDNDVDERGVRWASLLQTWIELKKGDARQQDAARDLYRKLLP